jgi:hypothetical protein
MFLIIITSLIIRMITIDDDNAIITVTEVSKEVSPFIVYQSELV